MAKFTTTLFILLFAFFNLFGQTSDKDTDALLDSARNYIYSDNVKSYFFINKLENSALEKNNQSALAYVHQFKAIIDESIGDNESALKNLESGIDLATQASDITAKYRIMIALSNYYLNRSNFQKCIETCQVGIKGALAISDFEIVGQFYNNLSLCYSYMGDYKNALRYSGKSIELKKKSNEEEPLANAYLNKGLILTNTGDYENGFDFYTKAVSIYLKTSNHAALTQTYINYAWDYTDLKQFSKARVYLDKAMKQANLANSVLNQSGVWNAFGHYYQVAGFADSVTYALNQALEFSLKTDNKRNALVTYEELSNHYSERGNQELALEYLQKAYYLKDTILNESKLKLTELLNIRYETLQKEESIKLLNAQNENDQLLIQKQHWTLVSIILIFLVLAILSFTLFIFYKKHQKVKKKKELYLQKEVERSRIARDMHDDIGSRLTRIVMRSDQTKSIVQSDKELKQEILENIEKISTESRELTQNLSEIIWALNPKSDTLDALYAYIRTYTYDFLEDYGISCQINFPDEIPNIIVSPELRRNIFLIVKESLNNMVKYSGATLVELTLQLSDKQFSFSIKDNGKGIDPYKESRSGNGLENMKKRADELGGTLNILSEKNAGTTIQIKNIPLEKNPTLV